MGWRLAQPGDALVTGHVKRFDPRFWTVNFPRPMMASVVTTAADALRVDAIFYRTDDLAGLIWESEDVHDHPLLAYETDRDFRRCQLRFRWRSAGVLALDAINGPTLTIEGRDAEGNPRAWYVRLWNYAEGVPDDAVVSIDFGDVDGGFLLPGEADPVWAGDVDRMFISLVPTGFGGLAEPLAEPVAGWVEVSDIACDGSGSVLAIGDVMVPEHQLRMASGYDDSYHLTPARLLRNIVQLGYRAVINHYVGMSHYFRLEWNAGAGRFMVSLAGGVLNAPCAAWHADFAAKAKALGSELILSLSYELFDEHVWGDWKQRAADGSPALTGWVPPSTLLSPAHSGAMAYLQQVARAFVAIAVAAGQAPRFQIGEPWWWIMPDGRPCLYDDASRAALGGAPVAIVSVRAPLDADENTLLDAAGALLAASTLALRDAVRAEAPGCEVAILVYLPTVLDPAAPELQRANVPVGWASPAFDVLQLEDYDWVTGGHRRRTAAGVAAATARLRYPIEEQHYFSGFVLNAADRAQWAPIDAAAEAARERGAAEVFVWALPQVARDGYVHFDEEAQVQPFDDVSFPIALGRQASVAPEFSTAVVTGGSGVEQRNSEWEDARMRFDVGAAVRSEADMRTLIDFFRARRGAAKAFRFRDPLDGSSAPGNGAPGVLDQLLGEGDGLRSSFPLVKRYGGGAEAQVRRISRPVEGSVRVALDGIEQFDGWANEAGGTVAFDDPPAAGVVISAGFHFDVPVRFADDRLEVSLATHLAGEIASVPLIEVREG